mgnify:CR=1 FL=1
MNLGHTIASLRKFQSMNQREFAQLLGVSNGAVAMWETNKRQPDLDTLCKIANLFSVPTDYLLGVGVFKDWDILLKNKASIIEQISKATKRISESMLYGLDDVTFARLAYAFDVHIVLREDGNSISITDPIPTYTDTIFSNEIHSSEDIILSLLRSQTEEERNDIKNLITSFCSLSAKDKTKVLGKCFDLEDLNRSSIQSSPKTGTDNLGK